MQIGIGLISSMFVTLCFAAAAFFCPAGIEEIGVQIEEPFSILALEKLVRQQYAGCVWVVLYIYVCQAGRHSMHTHLLHFNLGSQVKRVCA